MNPHIEYQITPPDLAKCMVLRSAPGTIYQIASTRATVGLVWVVIAAGLAAAVVPSLAFAPSAPAFGPRILATLVFVGLGTVIATGATRRQPGRLLEHLNRLGGIPHPKLECRAELTPEGLMVTSQAGFTLINWGSMLTPIRHDQYLLYPQNALEGQPIPTRAFATPESLESWWAESMRLFDEAAPTSPPQAAGPVGYPVRS